MSIREFIESHEGGLSGNPNDPGGLTKYGVSFRFLRLLHPSVADIDGDGDVDADDILHLTKDDAWRIFEGHIFEPVGILLLNGKVGDVCKDAAVNMGGPRAVKILQETVNYMGGRLKVDGWIGAKTVAGATSIPTPWFIPELLLGRLAFYKKITERNKKLKEFYGGWVNRVINLRAFVK